MAIQPRATRRTSSAALPAEAGSTASILLRSSNTKGRYRTRHRINRNDGRSVRNSNRWHAARVPRPKGLRDGIRKALMIRRVILSSAELAFRPNNLLSRGHQFRAPRPRLCKGSQQFPPPSAVGDFVRQGRKRAQERGVRFGPAAEADPATAAGGPCSPTGRRDAGRCRPELRGGRHDHRAASGLTLSGVVALDLARCCKFRDRCIPAFQC